MTISMNRRYFMNGASRAAMDLMAAVANEDRAVAGGEEKSKDFGIIASSEFLADLTVPRGMFGQLPRENAIVIPPHVVRRCLRPGNLSLGTEFVSTGLKLLGAPPVIDGSWVLIGEATHLTHELVNLPDDPDFEGWVNVLPEGICFVGGVFDLIGVFVPNFRKIPLATLNLGLAAKSAKIFINGDAELNEQETQRFEPFIVEVVRLSTAAALGQNYTLPMLAKSAEQAPIANLTISRNPAVGRSTIGMALAMSGFMPMAVSGVQSLLHRVQEKIKQEDEASWESREGRLVDQWKTKH